MKSAIAIIVLFSGFSLFSRLEAESLETLQAKYDADVAREKAQVEAAVFQHIISQKGIFKDATDYYKTGFYDKQYNLKKKEAEKRVNQLKGDKKTNTLEYYKATEEFYNFQKMEYKELSANLEKKWYDSISYWAVEGMKGSWNDAKIVVAEVWSKKWDLLKTFIDSGIGDAVKSLIYETIEATYKMRFVDYAIKTHGATGKIAEYWWDHFIMGNFQKSKPEELIEDVVSKGQEKLQEKLEEKVKERVKDELIKKGEKLAKDALENKAKEAAESFIRNLITVPSILVECAAKYYNVADFNLMFLEAAPNEANYINNEIKKVLKELNKLNDVEINRCYFNADYFMSLRKTVVKENNPPKFTQKNPSENKENKVKVRVKSRLQPAVETAWQYFAIEEKAKEQAKKTQELAPDNFDLQPYLALIDAAVNELRNDAIDYPAFRTKVGHITGQFDQALDSWSAAVITKSSGKANKPDPDVLNKKKVGYKSEFTKALDAESAKIDKELKDYHALISAAAEFEVQDELKALQEAINSKITAFVEEAETRSIELSGKNYLAPKREAAFTSEGGGSTAMASFKGLVENTSGVRRCLFAKAIEKPLGATGQFYQNSVNKGHIHNSVTVVMAGEWFAKSLYEIWHTGYHGSLKLKEYVEQKRRVLNELLNPEKNLWKVYAANAKGETVFLKDVAAAVNIFKSRSQADSINAIYKEFAAYDGFTHNLLRKNEDAIAIALAVFAICEAKLDAEMSSHAKAMMWINTKGKEIEDANFVDWKAITRSSVELIAELIANKTTPEDLGSEAERSIQERDRIRAGQKYTRDMAKIESDLRVALESRKASIFMQIEPMYKDYFAKHTVPEKAAFTRLAEYPARIENALKDKVTTKFSDTRIAELYKNDPGYYMKDLLIDLRTCEVAYEQNEFFRYFVWGAGEGRFENMKQLAALHSKAKTALDEVNKWAMAEYEALDKKVTAGETKIKTVKEYQELSSEFERISLMAQQKFAELVKPDQRYVHIKYNDKVTEKLTDISKKLLKINRSLPENL